MDERRSCGQLEGVGGPEGIQEERGKEEGKKQKKERDENKKKERERRGPRRDATQSTSSLAKSPCFLVHK